MLSYDEMREKLQSALSPRRFIHTLGVVDIAVKLAQHYHEDEEQAKIAALLHDCAKDYPDDLKRRLCKEYHIPVDAVIKKQIDLAHAWLGAEVAKREYGIKDQEILNAIRFHTTGRANMSDLEKIIFLADYIEPNRKYFEGLDEIRQAAYENLDQAMKRGLENSILFVKQKEQLLHPLTTEALKYLEDK